MWSRIVLLGCLAATAPAQIAPGHAVVVTDHPGQTPRARLYDVDPVSGTIVPLPRFPYDNEAPLAVAIDPVDGDVAVAVASSAGFGSTAWRLRFRSGVLVSSRGLVAGFAIARDLGFASRGDVVVGFDSLSGTSGLISRVDRGTGVGGPIWNGGPLHAVEFLPLGNYAYLVDEPATGPELSLVDLDTGQPLFPAVAIPGLAGARVTGVHDLPTGAIRQVLTDDQGRVHLFEFLAHLRTLTLSPPLPPGGAVAMRGDGLDAIVLGGQTHPYLIRVSAFGGASGTWQTIAGPLPGDPVDFAFAPAPGARVVRFGAVCGGGGSATWTGSPTVGNTAFAVGLQNGPTLAPAVLALGLDDLHAGSVSLPTALPDGCPLLVSAESIMPTALDQTGHARFVVPVPPVPALVGARAFAQWIALSGTLTASDALAVWIGS